MYLVLTHNREFLLPGTVKILPMSPGNSDVVTRVGLLGSLPVGGEDGFSCSSSWDRFRVETPSTERTVPESVQITHGPI